MDRSQVGGKRPLLLGIPRFRLAWGREFVSVAQGGCPGGGGNELPQRQGPQHLAAKKFVSAHAPPRGNELQGWKRTHAPREPGHKGLLALALGNNGDRIARGCGRLRFRAPLEKALFASVHQSTSVLHHPQDNLEAEILARDGPEGLQGVVPDRIELGSRVEVGHGIVLVAQALPLAGADLEGGPQVVAARPDDRLAGAVPVVDREHLPATGDGGGLNVDGEDHVLLGQQGSTSRRLLGRAAPLSETCNVPITRPTMPTRGGRTPAPGRDDLQILLHGELKRGVAPLAMRPGHGRPGQRHDHGVRLGLPEEDGPPGGPGVPGVRGHDLGVAGASGTIW